MSKANQIAIIETPDVWELTRNGQTLAVIDRAWDEVNFFVFLADGREGLACHGARGHLAALKTCLKMWARRNTSGFPPFFVAEEAPY